MKPKVLLLTPTNLGPYHQARYNLLANSVELVVVKCPTHEFHRPWKTMQAVEKLRVLAPFEDKTSSPLLSFSKMWRLLRQEKPNIVITVGYNNLFIWLASAVCKLLSLPCVLYLVGWQEERHRPWMKEQLKSLYVRVFFSAAVVTGQRAADYARNLGVAPAHIYIIGNPVNNEHFRTAEAAAIDQWQQQVGTNFFLTVSRLSTEKNITVLLQAFQHYALSGGSWNLVIAGSGSEESRLKRQVPLSLQERVHWLSWVDYESLPALYHAASCFILPSYIEPWGLVVNEALAAGKPLLLSQQCGCVPELCDENRNCSSFDPYKPTHLARLMTQMEHCSLKARMAMEQASQEIAETQSLESWRRCLVGAVQAILVRQ